VSLIVVGLNHRTVPIEVLERVSVPSSRLSKALHDVAAREHLAESVVLSTCNRTEVYARCTRFHPAVGDVRDFLAELSGADPDELSDHLYTYVDDAATAHLFSVAAGLDSMIVGESEILGQVRSAWLAAEKESTSGHLLGGVFRHAVESGKRVRTETQIGRHPVSISSAAVAVAAEHLGGLEGCRVLVIGAGEMADGMAVALANRGVAEICVANRTLGHGSDLARRVGGRAVELDALPAELAQADLVLASTGSSDVLVERSAVEAAVAGRPDRPLLVVDVAMPRDIDPGVGAIPSVTLLDIDDLKDFARRSSDRRRAEIGRAREILNEELDRYRSAREARQAVPLVVALREMGDDIRARELERFGSRFADLDEATRADIEALTRGLVNKLLHEPTVRLKAAAGTDLGSAYAETLAALFDLPGADT
jgi:glutamyl-tRNA reductase